MCGEAGSEQAFSPGVVSCANPESNMTVSRPALLAIIAVLGVVCVAAVGAYMHERNQRPGVEIRMDDRGLRIEGR
jgi:hypothetical protein